jgi:hypothetical protein
LRREVVHETARAKSNFVGTVSLLLEPEEELGVVLTAVPDAYYGVGYGG